MGWTREQERAIEERGKNILVAAAAGSGKTAVLIERIKKLVQEDGVPVDRMLIVTFTNAAAAEMKEKLRKSLTEEIEKNPENGDRMRAQLRLLPRASISTFHAFALEVIRRFFFFIDLEPGFSICEEAQKVILKEDAMDELLENFFAEGSQEFYDFLDSYSSDRDLDNIRATIDSAYNILQSLPYPWEWLREKVEQLGMEEEELSRTDSISCLWDYCAERMAEAEVAEGRAIQILQDSRVKRLADRLAESDLSQLQEIKRQTEERNFARMAAALEEFRGARLSPEEKEKEAYGEIKAQVGAYRDRVRKILKELRESFFLQPLEEQMDDLHRTKPQAETLQRLLLAYDELFQKRKREKKLLDFSDIEHYCLSILQNPEAAEYYQKKYAYIFIDEYQDTNILQEEIIGKIKGKKNLFMVGDIKQSIYKFRLAEPEIFKEKYESYRAGQNGDSMKIDLNRNFRSKPEILDGINRIFGQIMEGYDDTAKLYAGIPYTGEYSYKPQIRIVDGKTLSEADEEIAALRSAEIEALEVCRLIQQNLGRKIYDQKTGEERTINLRDIVILMRGVRNYGDIFFRILREQGIDAFIDDSESYFDTIEIDILMKLLSVIDNRMQDIPLLSVLHSEIFGFSADALARIRIEHKEGLYAEAFLSYSEEGTDLPLREKCGRVLEQLSHWKTLSLSMPLGKFIWKVLMESGYYLQMGAMPRGVQRQMNLRVLIDKAEGYAKERQGSLYNFIRYIETLRHRKVQVGQVKLVGETDELVRIMTIHKSKGLEFPMVILAGAGRKLNYTTSSRAVLLHKDIGIGMTYVNYKECWRRQTLLQRIIRKQIHREEVEEEIRILYVAMTRARDLLYITGIVRDAEKFADDSEQLAGDSSYLSMIGDSYPKVIVDAASLHIGESTGEEDSAFAEGRIYRNLPAPALEEEIRRRLNYRYPFHREETKKSKYSVSELSSSKERGRAEPVTLAVPKFRQGERRLTAAERGTVYHLFMEHLDFGEAAKGGAEYIRRRGADYMGRGLLTAKELGAVDPESLAAFFSTAIGKRCVLAAAEGRLQRERSFDLQMEMDGETVIVQGMIDCYFEEEDGLVLLDYKSNRIDERKGDAEEERLRSTYKTQMEIYRKALESGTGKKVREMYLYHFESHRTIKM